MCANMCVSKFICVSYEFSLALYFFLFLSYSSVFLFVYYHYYYCYYYCYYCIPAFISIRMNKKIVDLGMWGSGKYLEGLVDGKL